MSPADCTAAPVTEPAPVGEAPKPSPPAGWPEAVASSAPKPALTELQNEYLTAYTRFDAATGMTDSVTVGLESADQAEPEYQAAQAHIDDTLKSVASYKPHDLAEMQAKYAFLARKECYPLHDRAEFIMELVQEDALFLQRTRVTVAPRPRPGLTILPPDAEHDGPGGLTRSGGQAPRRLGGVGPRRWDGRGGMGCSDPRSLGCAG